MLVVVVDFVVDFVVGGGVVLAPRSCFDDWATWNDHVNSNKPDSFELCSSQTTRELSFRLCSIENVVSRNLVHFCMRN